MDYLDLLGIVSGLVQRSLETMDKHLDLLRLKVPSVIQQIAITSLFTPNAQLLHMRNLKKVLSKCLNFETGLTFKHHMKSKNVIPISTLNLNTQ